MTSTPPTVILDQVLALATMFGEDMARSDRKLGLTPARTKLLWMLQMHGPLTQRELATLMGVSARNITGLVDALTQTGFVTREPHPADRRAFRITFTRKAERTMTQMHADHEKLADDLLSGLSPERRERFYADVSVVTGNLAQLIAEFEASR